MENGYQERHLMLDHRGGRKSAGSELQPQLTLTIIQQTTAFMALVFSCSCLPSGPVLNICLQTSFRFRKITDTSTCFSSLFLCLEGGTFSRSPSALQQVTPSLRREPQ